MPAFEMKRSFDLSSYYHHYFQEHQKVTASSQQALSEDFENLVSLCQKSIEQGGKIFFFGNGGSAADAQHLATELTVRFSQNRKPVAALALTTDTSALTAIGNDLGFNYLFSRQIEALGKAGDVAIGITTSGKSPNVLKAFEMAHHQGLRTVAFTGEAGIVASSEFLTPPLDLVIKVPSRITSHIQEMHITLGQMLCGALENVLGLITPEPIST